MLKAHGKTKETKESKDPNLKTFKKPRENQKNQKNQNLSTLLPAKGLHAKVGCIRFFRIPPVGQLWLNDQGQAREAWAQGGAAGVPGRPGTFSRARGFEGSSVFNHLGLCGEVDAGACVLRPRKQSTTSRLQQSWPAQQRPRRVFVVRTNTVRHIILLQDRRVYLLSCDKNESTVLKAKLKEAPVLEAGSGPEGSFPTDQVLVCGQVPRLGPQFQVQELAPERPTPQEKASEHQHLRV